MKHLLFILTIALLSCQKEDANCYKCTMSTIKYGDEDSSGAHTSWYETYNIENFCDVTPQFIREFEEGRTVIGYSKCECERK